MIDSFFSNSSKGAIIVLLSEDFPLSAKVIHSKIKREFAINVSYQAVHKLLLQLLKENILIKNNSKYSLNPKYIDRIVSFSNLLKEKYSSNKKLSVKEMISFLESGQSLKLNFDSVAEAGAFVIDEYYCDFPILKGKESFCFWQNIIMPVGFHDAKRLVSFKKMLSRTKHYSVSKSNTFIEQYLAESLKRMGKKIALNVNYPFDQDIYLCGDCVLQTFFSKDFLSELNSFYSKIKKLEDFKIEKYNELLTKKTSIKIIISKNPELSNLFRKQGLNLFKEALK